MSRFLKQELAVLDSYVPGEQPQDKTYIKLNTNESPFPPSEGVCDAVNHEVVQRLRLYCNPDATVLKAKLAEVYNENKENIFVSNGSDDILNFAFLAFGSDGVIFPDISYGFYEVFAKLHGIPYEKAPLKDDFTIDISDYCNQNKMIAIANPNAPTGIALSLSEIEEIVKSNPDHVVLIDEAYVDFGGESCAPLTQKYENLLCVQTFSKSRSMAGARLGFAIAQKAIIDDLEKIKFSTNPYSINSLTQAAGAAALDDNDYYMENCGKIIENREFAKRELESLGFEVLPSKTNFLFAKTDKVNGKELYLKLKDKGILVRHFEKPRIAEYNRITVGSRQEMETLIQKVKEILGE